MNAAPSSLAVGALLTSFSIGAVESVPEDVLASETCQEHVLQEPSMALSEFPKEARGQGEYNAYVVVSYKLDGSGKAVDLRIVKSEPKKLFDKTTLSLLARTNFARDAIADECTYVRTYSAVRRRNR